MTDITPKYLDDFGFEEYYSATTKDSITLEDHMYPPERAQYVFMGCGNSENFRIGIIATPEEIFGKEKYTYAVVQNAKSLKNFYKYHSNELAETTAVIGFSSDIKIELRQCDQYDVNDKLRMCSHTTNGPSTNHLWRCGDTNIGSDYRIAFYFK